MTVAEAAHALGLTIKGVYRNISRGVLQAEYNGRLDISPDEVERYKQERRKAGRPKKVKE